MQDHLSALKRSNPLNILICFSLAEKAQEIPSKEISSKRSNFNSITLFYHDNRSVIEETSQVNDFPNTCAIGWHHLRSFTPGYKKTTGPPAR
jgi:hypothetical protein